MSLVEHAKRELKAAGLYDKDSDYGGMLAHATVRLIKVFAKEGHSGFSAELSIQLFEKLARFKTLTPITDNPDEWMDISEHFPNMHQNMRDSSLFSKDGGRTYYSVDDEHRAIHRSQSCITKS